mmetsp:Transcript_16593/g.35633  ORF Transcript_16593/g.35633 Transcript_16593/m.35633 type:complete len:85 (-) Transcript_16593:573-827(-)
MGREKKVMTLDNVKLKVRRGGGQNCGAEFMSYLACMDPETGSDAGCGQFKQALTACMERAKEYKGRHKPPINYHLQQFLRRFKK